jgi:ketosteroid isomerase-like protein
VWIAIRNAPQTPPAPMSHLACEFAFKSMKTLPRFLLFFAAFSIAIGGPARAQDRAQAERTITEYYRDFQDAFAQKNAARIYQHCDPSYTFTGLDGAKTTVAENRRNMEESLTKLRSIHVTVNPEAMELAGSTFLVRYQQRHEIQFPLKPSPSVTWFTAEDTWQNKNGEWRLVSTKVVNDSMADWKQRLAAQKNQMEAEDEQRRSARCLNGLGYGCGVVR